MENSYSLLRAEINRLVPSRLKLEFGCEIQRNDDQRYYKVIEELGWGANTNKVWINSIPFGSMALPREVERNQIIERDDVWTIHGKPIEIADVLLALVAHDKLTGNKSYVRLEMDGWLRNVIGVGIIPVPINLSLPLSSPENEVACTALLALLK